MDSLFVFYCNENIFEVVPDQTITDRICKEQFITSTSRGNDKQLIFLEEKDFADFLRSLIFGGKKISLPITCLLSDEPPLSSTYGNLLRVTYQEGCDN
jgi:hypothetical protein